MELLVVTFQRDFPYLTWLFRSMVKFCSGFSAVRVLVPTPDFAQAETMTQRFLRDKGFREAVVQSYDEWPGLGFLHHMAQIMRADEWCPAADFIGHIDADCCFTSPVTPDTYIRNGKPIMRYEYFSKLGRRHPGAAAWQAPTQACLPFLVSKETMRCHPGVFHRGLYAEARRQIELKVKEPWEEYLKKQKNDYPQTFVEFVTLGNVALHCFPEKYEAVEQIGDLVTPDNCVQQFHSPDPIDRPQTSWVKGEEKLIVPLQFIREILK
jgi:uncharacterized protein DUF6492